jgi:hypothetical protein
MLTVLIAAATVYYAFLTSRLVDETRKVRLIQSEPKIEIVLEPFDFAVHIMRLRIKNIGMGAAKNVMIIPEVVQGGRSGEVLLADFTRSNFFKCGIRYLGPGQALFSTYTQTSVDPEGKCGTILSFRTTFENSEGKKYKDEVIMDMAEIRDHYRLGRPNLYSIAKSLEKIQGSLDSIAEGRKRIQADTYDSEDRQKERQLQEIADREFLADWDLKFGDKKPKDNE